MNHASHARAYLGEAWSPIPLPAGKKWPPPPGLTGWDGRYVQSLERFDWSGNIGIRLPPDVIGIDVDVYHGGDVSLKELIVLLGELPDTVMSTSRTDGSGIRLFRVPVGTTLRTTPAVGIDMIQCFHRYVVGAPSVHPEGGTYQWIGEQSGEILHVPPHPGELPDLPWAWVQHLTAAKGAGACASTPQQAVAFVSANVDARRPGALDAVLRKIAAVRTGGRHDALLSAACWMARESAAGWYSADDAFNRLHGWWGQVVDAHRADSGEFGAAVLWGIGQATANPDRVEQLRREVTDRREQRHRHDQHHDDQHHDQRRDEDEVAGEPPPPPPRSSATTTMRSSLELPERFWERPRHAAIRDAAAEIGVTPESLVLAVLILVAAHIPAAIVFPGDRQGVPNLLGALVGRPGKRKGVALDRALELIPAPRDTRHHMLGTAQGLVKEFFRATTKLEQKNDPDLPPFVRHTNPVIVRDNEVGRFVAATAGASGQDLVAHLKLMVFGEQLGQGVSSVEKNLRCAPRTYRSVGVVGVAPGVAGPLFDDIDGGLPQRLLFAAVRRNTDGTIELDDLEEFDDLTLDDTEDTDDDGHAAGGYLAFDPIQWTPPAMHHQHSFADSRKVAERIRRMQDVDWALLDAHTPYLTHALAAVVAYFDGRHLIQPADLTLAGDIISVSRSTRAALLDVLQRSEADGHRRRAQQRKDEAVETAEAVEHVRLDVARYDASRSIVALVRLMTDTDGQPPTRREVGKRRRNAAEAIDEAIGLGWLLEEVEQTSVGGSARKTLTVTKSAP